MIATNELAACRPPSGTSVLRPTAIPRPQPQHPRSIAPRQSQSRTAYNPLADLLEDDLPAHCSPSQPPLPRVLRRTIESAQYAAAYRLNRRRLWNTGCPGQAGARRGRIPETAFPRFGSEGKSTIIGTCAGWVSRRRNPPLLPPRIQKWWVTALVNPLPESPYSAAICLGAGGGLTRSAASWA